MALWACRGCTTRFSVGAPACPHCGSTDHYEEGSDMAKITVHGGATVAGASVVGAAWSDTSEPDKWPASVGERGPELWDPNASLADNLSATPPASVSVDETLGGDFKPLSEAVEGDSTEQVSEPDYENWTKTQLQEVLADRELPTSGTKAELVARLRTHDEP